MLKSVVFKSFYRSIFGGNYAHVRGRREKAQKSGGLLDIVQEGAADPVTIAVIYAGLGIRKVLYWIGRGYEIRSGLMVYLKSLPDTFLKAIASDPRYLDYMQKMGF